MHAFYLIQNSETRELYFGVTADLAKRLQEHNAGGKKFTTRKIGIWQYIYIEAYRSRTDALDRERQLKRHANGKQQLLKRLKRSLLEPKIGEGRSERTSGDCLPKTQLPANS